MPAPSRPPTVVVVHAHPDDEAIFTGLTLRRLADRGGRVVLVTATGGEAGLGAAGPGRLRERRLRELEQACSHLGVARLVLLGRRDSGLPGAPEGWHPRALRRARVAPLARQVAAVVREESAVALVHDDPAGIYGHPDHVAAHRVAAEAGRLAGVPRYEVTVERTHLHGRHEHLVARAAASVGRASAGRPADEIGLVVNGTGDETAAKRAAMAAHASQIGAAAVADVPFTDYYGREWLTRRSGSPVLEAPLADTGATASPFDPGPTGSALTPAERTPPHAHR